MKKRALGLFCSMILLSMFSMPLHAATSPVNTGVKIEVKKSIAPPIPPRNPGESLADYYWRLFGW